MSRRTDNHRVQQASSAGNAFLRKTQRSCLYSTITFPLLRKGLNLYSLQIAELNAEMIMQEQQGKTKMALVQKQHAETLQSLHDQIRALNKQVQWPFFVSYACWVFFEYV